MSLICIQVFDANDDNVIDMYSGVEANNVIDMYSGVWS